MICDVISRSRTTAKVYRRSFSWNNRYVRTDKLSGGHNQKRGWSAGGLLELEHSVPAGIHSFRGSDYIGDLFVQQEA